MCAAGKPAFFASAATVASRSTRRAPSNSLQPSRPNAHAAAAPKPLEAPVMRTHLFSRFVGMQVFLRALVGRLPPPFRKLFPGRRGDLKIVRAKRRGRQTGAVEQIDHRIIGPTVADRNRLVDLWAADDDFAVFDLGIGPDELSVLAANG